MSLAFRHGRGVGRNWQEAIRACIGELEALPFRATLGFVCFTDRLVAHAAAIVDALRRRTGVPHWVGGVGIGVLDGEISHDRLYGYTGVLALFLRTAGIGENTRLSGICERSRTLWVSRA